MFFTEKDKNQDYQSRIIYYNKLESQATVQLWYRATVAPAVGSTQMSGVYLNK